VKISEKIINDIEVTNDQLIFLLWNTLIQLSAYDDDVDIVPEESFNIEQVLRTLEDNLNIHPEGAVNG